VCFHVSEYAQKSAHLWRDLPQDSPAKTRCISPGCVGNYFCPSWPDSDVWAREPFWMSLADALREGEMLRAPLLKPDPSLPSSLESGQSVCFIKGTSLPPFVLCLKMAYRNSSDSPSPSPTSSSHPSPRLHGASLDIGTDDQDSPRSTPRRLPALLPRNSIQTAGKGGCWCVLNMDVLVPSHLHISGLAASDARCDLCYANPTWLTSATEMRRNT